MANNLFEEYVEISTKNIYKYLKLIFKSNYDGEVAQTYVKTYINSRYYNLSYKENSRVFYLRLKESLQKTMDALLKDNKTLNKDTKNNYAIFRKKEKIIKDMYSAFDYIFFFDKVRNIESMKSIKKIEEVVDRLYKLREEQYEVRERQNTKKEFTDLVKQTMKQTDEFIDMYFIDKAFSLDIKKIGEKNNLYNIELDANVDMPMIYSSEAIKLAYNSKRVEEERLFVEYMLLSLLITRDIVELNFRDEYIVEFDANVIEKKQKKMQLLSIIDDPALQDKINLKIKYEDFLNYKDQIFDLIREGYKFALILDEKFEDVEELKKLQMFSYIFVSKELKNYKDIVKFYKKSDKIIYE